MMETAGIPQSNRLIQTVSVLSEYKKLMELQKEMVVKLIESASVPLPSNNIRLPGLGNRIDILI